jgi:mRNA interferase MazF
VRGDVYRLPPRKDGRGHEQRGRRLGVVIQSDLLRLSTLLIAPTSTNALATVFRPEVEIQGERTRVMVEQTTAVDAQRLRDKVGRLSNAELMDVDAALRVVFGLM